MIKLRRDTIALTLQSVNPNFMFVGFKPELKSVYDIVI